MCGEDAEHLVVNREKLLAWNPEVVILWANDRKDPKDVVADPQWGTVSAVKTGRVHELPEVFLCDLWTLKFVHAVKTVAKWVQPDLFRDLDLKREEAKMLSALYGPAPEAR